jgi:hypothetical protein
MVIEKMIEDAKLRHRQKRVKESSARWSDWSSNPRIWLKLLKQKADFLKLLFVGHRLTRREGCEVLNNSFQPSQSLK